MIDEKIAKNYATCTNTCTIACINFARRDSLNDNFGMLEILDIYLNACCILDLGKFLSKLTSRLTFLNII